ncbi:hypothetical protein TNCV_458271 [Trichonephila clavipes]|nr:hypothetical protein TNCV_458271 [Trichonephila clavipes]
MTFNHNDSQNKNSSWISFPKFHSLARMDHELLELLEACLLREKHTNDGITSTKETVQLIDSPYVVDLSHIVQWSQSTNEILNKSKNGGEETHDVCQLEIVGGVPEVQPVVLKGRFGR